jgi:hypothetical protein
MASAIMDMMNYGNTNTNKMTTQEWLNQTGSDGISYANSLFDKTWDSVTNQRISALDPRLQNPAADFINDVNNVLGITLRVTNGYRSIEEQNALYSKGRDEKGNIIGQIVTNAKGGSSYHNYGLAIDIANMKNQKIPIYEIPNQSIVDIGKNYNFEWGGDWKSLIDYPHFQMSFGQNYRYYKNSNLINQEIQKK